MKRILFLTLPALLAAAACSDQPAGQPVVTVDLGDEDDVSPLNAPVPETGETVPTALASSAASSSCSPASFEGVDLTH